MKLAVIDGSSLLFRAFYALPLLSSKSGVYTNAIVGFYNMLARLLKDENPDGVIIAFDKSKETFRKKKYADYKGTRKPTPEELKMQIPMLKEFASALGICLIEMEGYEADDIIGTLSVKAAAKGDDVLVITGDRDALQLIRQNLRVYLTKKGISEVKIYDEAAFTEEYGVEPIRLIDLKGLMGDTSDNIPGVPNVGEKTAIKLLREYGSLENVYDNLDKITGKKLKENLANYKEQAYLSKELATICLDTPDLEPTAKEYAIKPNFTAFREFCRKYELNKILSDFEKRFKPEEKSGSLFEDISDYGACEVSLDFETIDDLDTLEKFNTNKPLAFGLHTVGRAADARLLGVMLNSGENMGYVAAESLIFLDAVELLRNTKTLWTVDKKILYHAGFKDLTRAIDIFLGLYLIFPEAEGKLDKLASLALPDKVFPQKLKDPLQILAMQTIIARSVGQRVLEELKELDLLSLYQDIEEPLIKVLYEIESAGVYLDAEKLKAESLRAAEKLDAIEKEIYALAGETFNLNSTKMLGAILFEKLGYPTGKKTKRGYSTDVEVLEGLKSEERPIIEKILEYRTFSKLKSTYLDGLLPLISKKTHRLHTAFNQKVTATGRLSSSEPNLQNIPVRTEAGRAIREMFIPNDGYELFLSADYSQIELRILAHLSKDKNMIDAFLKGDDIHSRTAAEVFNTPIKEVTKEQRRRAKAVNFGIVYGISDFGLAKDLGITRHEAKEYIEKYFEKFSGIKAYIENTVKNAKEKGYVKTMFGRRRALPELFSRNFNIRSFAERMAMNTPIQGSAADIIKLAMIRTYNALKTANLKSRILLQVHDELVIETTEAEIEKVKEIVKDAMENVVKLEAPLRVDINVGENWGECK